MLWQTFTITKLELMNFKRFFGRHEIDLSTQPREGKTVVLIGGENGRGKTSIYEAVNYTLYVDTDLLRPNARWMDYRSTMSWPDYRTAVSERLNRRALELGHTDYWVALELVAMQHGQERKFRIERRWDVDVRQRCIIKPPVLTISEKGRPVADVPETAYQDFLRDLLPPGIAPYFFFDGARIQEFAEDDSAEHAKVMGDAIQNILHIDVYRRLRSDLKKYVVDPLEREIQQSEQDDKIRDLTNQVEDIEKDIATKNRRLRSIHQEREEKEEQKRFVEVELRRVATNPAHRHDELVEGKERIETDLDTLKQELEGVARLLPLILAGSLLGQLEAQLRDEALLVEKGQIVDLKNKISQLEERLFVGPPPVPQDMLMTGDQEFIFRSRFKEAVNDLFQINTEKLKAKIHDVGEADRQKILDRLSQASNIMQTVRDLLGRREELHSELANIKRALEEISENPEIPRLLKESDGLNQKIGELNKEQQQIEFDIRSLYDKKSSLDREIQQFQRKREAATVKKRAVNLAQDAQEALQEFIKRLAPEKLKLLQRYFEEMYWSLRKADEDPVKSVKIDPETWVVSLLDNAGHPVKFGFSAGMKEMYALSLIWALAKASGRNLPIMIDFPGGHLDIHNFSALLNKFLPQAGHQVIVLSTDREFDSNAAKKLSPYIAQMYRLDWEPSSQSTVIQRGYFEETGK